MVVTRVSPIFLACRIKVSSALSDSQPVDVFGTSSLASRYSSIGSNFAVFIHLLVLVEEYGTVVELGERLEDLLVFQSLLGTRERDLELRSSGGSGYY